MKYIRYISLLALLVFYLGMVPNSCRAEGKYTLYESELTRLQQITEKLDKLNNQLQNELNNSRKNLIQLQNELESYETELTVLQNQLSQLKTESVQLKNSLMITENLLEKAEISFKQYKAEAEARIKKLSIQRNLAVIFGLIMVFI